MSNGPVAPSAREQEHAARLQSVASGALGTQALLEELLEPSWTLRRAVVAVLASRGQDVIPELSEALRCARDNEARLAGIVDALVASCGNVEAALLPLTADANPAVVCDAIHVLGRRSSEAALPTLKVLVSHVDDNIALAAIEALGSFGGAEVVDTLLSVVGGENFFRTFPAVDALGRTGDPRAVPALLPLLGNGLYAPEAARALGRLGDLSATRPLVEWLARSSEAFARVAAGALVAIHARALERFGTGLAVEQALLRHPQLDALRRRLTASVVRADATEKLALSQLLGWIGEAETAPTLIGLLDAAEPIARAAAAGLSRLGALAEPAMLLALQQEDVTHRRALIPLLGGRVAAREALSSCLRDADATVRALACDALAKIGDPRSVEPIFRLLGDADLRVAQAALSAIQSLGSDTTERLTLAATRASSAAVRRAAFRIVGYFGYDAAFSRVVDGVLDSDDAVRDAATAALATLQTPAARELALTMSGHASARARATACRTLGQFPTHPEINVRLREALSDVDPWVRYYACQALGRIRDEFSTSAIVALLRDNSGQVQVAALEALARLSGPEPLQALTLASASEDPDIQRAALVALGISKRHEARPILQRALGAGEPATRLVALSALAELGFSDDLRPLIGLTRDPDAAVRIAALGFLSSEVGQAASSALLDLLDHEPTRDDLVVALARPIAGRADTILAALQSAMEPLAVALVAALSRMNSVEAARALESALLSPNDASRRAAAAALSARGELAEKPLLERAALTDRDPEVRRLAAAVFTQ